jgi:hypothetical protein
MAVTGFRMPLLFKANRLDQFEILPGLAKDTYRNHRTDFKYSGTTRGALEYVDHQ